MSQLPLGIGLRDSATFANYLAGANQAVLAVLQAWSEPVVYLWGAPGTGKTHLLHAVCHAAAQRQCRSAYLPLAELEAYQPAMLEGLEQFDVVCLDDIQHIAARPDWETALFHAYNRIMAAGQKLLLAAEVSPTALGIELPDLRSRLGWGPVFQLQALADTDKRLALQQRARNRGVSLSDEVAEYLMRHCPRDMHSLFELLEELDRASLSAQRRLTIPFVRDYLARPAP